MAAVLTQTRPALSSTNATLWDRTVTPYLNVPLWRQSFAYDAGHILMPALHSAFASEQSRAFEFAEHFQRFLQNDGESLVECHPDHELARLHYLYLAATFCRLASAERSDLIPGGLADRLRSELDGYWSSKPMTWYSGSGFQGQTGMRSLLRWKNHQQATSPSYFSAINDHELFTVCALAELGGGHAAEATAMMGHTIRDRSYFTPSGGWLFQPGAWADHPDYAYAGNENLTADLQRKPLAHVAEDSSHGHRWPLFLRSLARSATQRDRTTALTSLAALDKQFIFAILMPATADFPAPRVRNYMDGWNGVYRYDYATIGSNEARGYGPSMLSGILPEGWWGFLPGAHSCWREFAASFPLPDNVIATYTGPNTTAKRHELVSWPQFFRNGFAELNVRLLAGL